MSQDYPEELSWLLSGGSGHELFLFENGREGLAKIDCNRVAAKVNFKIKSMWLCEVYAYPGVFEGKVAKTPDGPCLKSEELNGFELIFNNKFQKEIRLSETSEVKYIYLYFTWHENFNFEELSSNGFTCAYNGKNYPVKFEINRIKTRREFNDKRNSIHSDPVFKKIHVKQVFTLELIDYLKDRGENFTAPEYSIGYVGSDDGSNFETSLSRIFHLRENKVFTDLIIRANNEFDDVLLPAIRDLYVDLTGKPFAPEDIVQDHSEAEWVTDDETKLNLIIDTFTIQTWPYDRKRLCSTIDTIEKELMNRINALKDKGSLILVFPEELSAFGRVFHSQRENYDDLKDVSDDYRNLHHPKLIYFLEEIIARLKKSLENSQRKTLKILRRIDHLYIGGGLLIQKNPIDEPKPSEEGSSDSYTNESEVSKPHSTKAIDALLRSQYDALMEGEK